MFVCARGCVSACPTLFMSAQMMQASTMRATLVPLSRENLSVGSH